MRRFWQYGLTSERNSPEQSLTALAGLAATLFQVTRRGTATAVPDGRKRIRQLPGPKYAKVLAAQASRVPEI